MPSPPDQSASIGRQVEDLEAWHRSLQQIRHKPEFERIGSILPGVAQLTELQRDQSIVAVIIETRTQRGLLPAVAGALRHARLPVVVFHGRSNARELEHPRLRRLRQKGKCVFQQLESETLSLSEYNALLLSERFWRSFSGFEKVLVFQSDSFFCPGAHRRIGRFRHFDYIGPAWDRIRPIGIPIEGGCGGFSLRDVALSLESVRSMSPETWPGGEDSFFASAISALGGIVASPRESNRWAAQGSFTGWPVGGHQTWQLRTCSRLLLGLWCWPARRLRRR